MVSNILTTLKYDKSKHECMDGFPSEDKPWFLVLNPPKKQNSNFIGIKQSVVMMDEKYYCHIQKSEESSELNMKCRIFISNILGPSKDQSFETPPKTSQRKSMILRTENNENMLEVQNIKVKNNFVIYLS